MSDPKVLYLPIKKKWFDMIASGKKHEEYREIKDYWARRFIYAYKADDLEPQAWDEMVNDLKNPFKRHSSVSELLNYFGINIRCYDFIQFKNGYNKKSPEIMVEFNGIEIKRGIERWGAEKGVFYFTIHLGDIIYNYEAVKDAPA